ncbi:phosphotransferase enzyme family protein [Methyloligella sp. 2.7D]|uniref:phosphotransferase enzyme family protein n=1 Tax=unclassified Methyloligella TaxID=2625955 RepID=UPI00157D0082|nr:phosphotransferase enzyme family protein [Methyloligella sp. GL2]QKP76018.1 phosphotransferase enzyme family protein [Methyloligella sp. GL2]
MLYQDAFLERLETGLREALPNWGLPRSAPVSLLTISENATYLAEDEAKGRKIIFRVHRPDYHTEQEIRSELAWVSALREGGVVATPSPIPTQDGALLSSFLDDGQLRYIAAFEFMPGKEPDAEDDLVKWYGELGEINARLHAHGRAWERPASFIRKTWNFDAMIGDKPLWGDWTEAPGLTPEGRAILEKTSALLRQQTNAYGSGPDRFGLVHCDLRLANLLVEGDRLGVIDFDDCGFSWFGYDFAASVSFLEHEPYVPELMAAWVEGYREAASLSAEEEAALPMFVMLRRMQLTAWIGSHAETPTAQSMGVPYTEGSVALGEAYLSRNS